MSLRRLMMAGASAPSNVVSLVVASDTAYITSTLVSVGIPSNIGIGNRLIAVHFGRSTVTTPSGWTLVATTSTTGSGVLQIASIFTKISTVSDPGTTLNVAQASSVRAALHMLSFSGSLSTPSIVASGTLNTPDPLNSNVSPIAGVTPIATSRMAVISQSSVMQGGSFSAAVPAGYTQTTPAAVADNRLCVGYKTVAASENISGSFTWESTITSSSYPSVSVLLG